jgi:molybdopterin-binding protein
MRSLLPLLLVAGLCAADAPKAAPAASKLPTIPAAPIAKKKELLFEDNFEGAEADKRWVKVVPTFAVAQGVLKGTQTRDKTIPAADGKPEIRAHAAVHGLEVPTKDSIVECKVRFDGATMIDVEFDDRKFTGCHYGHICRAQLRFNPKDKTFAAVIIDEKDGNMRNDIHAMKNDPAKKAEVAKLLVGRQATFPVKADLAEGKWIAVVVETVGDEMRLSVDGQAVAYLKSSGIAHATKSRIEFGVAGKDGCLDDLKIWNAEPAK